MRILSRYVFRQTAGALVLIIVSLTGMTWIAVALRQLDLMTSQGQDALRFLAMTTLAIPTMMAVIAPIALLIASIHVLNRLNGDSELIVMTAGGAPVWWLLKPLGLLALLVALGVACVNHWVGPWAQESLRGLVVQVRSDLIAQVIQPWRFTSPEAKLTVHIRDRAPTGELLGLMMHDARDPKQIVTYLAERGTIIKQDRAAYLRMDKGHILRRSDSDPNPQIVAFERYVVDLQQLEQRIDQVQVLRPRERYTPELLWSSPDDAFYKQNRGRIIAELHERFASPLYAFAFVLVVIACMGQAQTTRQSRIQGVVGAFAIATVCRILGIATNNMVVVRPTLSPLLYAVPVGAAMLAAVSVQWHLYPRPPSRLTRGVALLMDGVGAWSSALWQRRPVPRPARGMRG
jgi:lipopolysaccharide export system permease protein